MTLAGYLKEQAGISVTEAEFLFEDWMISRMRTAEAEGYLAGCPLRDFIALDNEATVIKLNEYKSLKPEFDLWLNSFNAVRRGAEPSACLLKNGETLPRRLHYEPPCGGQFLPAIAVTYTLHEDAVTVRLSVVKPRYDTSPVYGEYGGERWDTGRTSTERINDEVLWYVEKTVPAVD